jgi:hypothetical protein
LAIACGHEDAIDFDRLRHDPLMNVAVGRCPQSGAPLASQSTISRPPAHQSLITDVFRFRPHFCTIYQPINFTLARGERPSRACGA